MISKNSDIITKTRLIRLIYYNDALLKTGTITKREHQRMNNAILAKYQQRKNTDKCSIYTKTPSQ